LLYVHHANNSKLATQLQT